MERRIEPRKGCSRSLCVLSAAEDLDFIGATVDISRSGMRVAVTLDPDRLEEVHVGREVSVDFVPVETAWSVMNSIGKVVWRKGCELGICFESLLPAASF